MDNKNVKPLVLKDSFSSYLCWYLAFQGSISITKANKIRYLGRSWVVSTVTGVAFWLGARGI